MAHTVNMHEAKTNFSKLARLVEQGDDVQIARDGVVFMRLVKVETELEQPRDFGKLKGLISPVTDEEWEAMDKAFLSSIEYSDWND